MLFGAALALGGCSTVMEANRPQAVNLKKFTIGEKRIDIIAQLGSPTGSEKDGERSCDVYSIYIHGVNGAGKGAIIVGEAAADVFTAGLFEVIATPAEAASKNKKHTVLFCYSSANALDLIRTDGKQYLPPPDRKTTPAVTADASKSSGQ
jgi:hypothetical protein